MAMMLSKTYDALVSAGAPEEKARAAAEELAAYETRFGKIEQDLVIPSPPSAPGWLTRKTPCLSL